MRYLPHIAMLVLACSLTYGAFDLLYYGMKSFVEHSLAQGILGFIAIASTIVSAAYMAYLERRKDD